MEKIKRFIESEQGKDVFIVLIVLLVGLASFGLGRLSKNDENKGIRIQYEAQSANALKASENSVLGLNTSSASEENTRTPAEFLAENPELSTQVSLASMKQFFASKRGKKYYPTGCSAGKSIKTQNRIYFDTSEQAEKAGYSLSTSC